MTPAKALALSAGVILVLVVDLVLMVRVFMPPEGPLLAALGVHASCASAAGALLSATPPSFLVVTRRNLGLFIACVAFFVPVLGVLGVVAVLAFGVSEPRASRVDRWIEHEPPFALAERRRRTVRSVQRRASAPDIVATLHLRAAQHAASRFRAVLATKRLPARLSVPVLKLAQRDPSDEVRLYAFSRLENMRDEIEQRIEGLQTALEDASEDVRPRLHLRLAESYWELGTSGLAEGAVRAHALSCAHRHARSACELAPSHAAAELVRGRVLLALRDADAAAAAFEAAVQAGYPRPKALLLLAECAFEQRDFGKVRTALSELEASAHGTADVRDLLALWAERDPSRPTQRPPAAVAEQTV